MLDDPPADYVCAGELRKTLPALVEHPEILLVRGDVLRSKAHWKNELVHDFLKRVLVALWIARDRFFQKFEDDLAVHDVLGERGRAELIVRIHELREALMVLLVIVDLLGLLDDARTLALHVDLAFVKLSV